MSITRRSHYLPQFYLRYFTVDNAFYEYDRKDNIFSIKSPHGSAWESFFYAFQDINSNKNLSIDNKILGLNEDKASITIDKIIHDVSLSDQDLVEFIIFMSLLKFRVPKFKNFILNKKVEKYKKDFFKEYKSIENKKKFIEDFNKSQGYDSGITTDNFIEKVYINDEEFEKGIFYYALIMNGFNHPKDFIKMDWYFIKNSTKTYFITSDDPIVGLEANKYNLSILESLGINNTKDLFIFAISKDLCLILNTNKNNTTPVLKDKFVITKEKLVLEIDRLIFENCYRYIFANDKSLIETIISIQL